MPNTYEPIATQTLGSAATSITFSSIPSTYTDLRVIFVGTGSGGVLYPCIQLNSDTGNSYSITNLYGNGSSAGSNLQSSVPYIALSNQDGATATIPMFISLDIFSYAGSTNKVTLSTNNIDRSGAGAIERIVGLWQNTAAINSIKIYDGYATRSIGTGAIATLYGIKNA
jgi:hypothetical protein